MSKIRCVIDTNVVISALISPLGKPNATLRHVLSQGVLLVSQETLEELKTRVIRPRLQKYIDPIERDRFFDLINARGVVVSPVQVIRACKDEDDNKFLELAVDGNADYLITGNLKDFPEEEFQGVRILNPAEFTQLISGYR